MVWGCVVLMQDPLMEPGSEYGGVTGGVVGIPSCRVRMTSHWVKSKVKDVNIKLKVCKKHSCL